MVARNQRLHAGDTDRLESGVFRIGPGDRRMASTKSVFLPGRAVAHPDRITIEQRITFVCRQAGVIKDEHLFGCNIQQRSGVAAFGGLPPLFAMFSVYGFCHLEFDSRPVSFESCAAAPRAQLQFPSLMDFVRIV